MKAKDKKLKAKGKKEAKGSKQWLGGRRQAYGLRMGLYPAFLPLLFAFCLFLVIPLYAHEEESVQSAQSALILDVGIDQRLNEQVPLDLMFRNGMGQLVQLGEYFGSKPVILVLAYYECQTLCPLVLDGLVSSLRVLSFNVGDQFTIVTVSIDPRETSELAAAKKEIYIQHYARPGAAEGWHFLTGDEASIKRLAQAIGFRYAYDAKQDQYVHASGIVVLTPQGKIARYFYGVEYSPRDLRLSLVEASANKIGSLVDQVLLLCYRYDPSTGKYSAIILSSVRLGGALTVLALGTFIFVMWHREKNNKIIKS